MKTILNRIIFFICAVALWEAVFRLDVFPSLIFPSVFTIFDALVVGIAEENLLLSTYHSLVLIFQGLGLGIMIALLLMAMAFLNKCFYNLVSNLIVFLNPIPGIAIFPLAILWFGAGKNSIIFVILHSVIWGLLLNMISGVNSILPIYKEVGLNLGLSRLRMVKDIYIPACMPEIISGVKIGLSRAWRTAIAAEMAFGIIGSNTGLGRHMSHMRNTLNIPGLFSGIILIAFVGILLEDVLFGMIEKHTVKKWGMTR